ncbi:BrnT family toxin [Shinella pollutisoli]|uniref:BrnT family toxin n=1 Tax=Shinella pollutisoli TaxID=2250594 RepID=A0ABV7DLB9_9HYPH|nr:BrnT family toxin [Shinella pollutisoli]
MKITFDPPKRAKTLQERGLDMADLTMDFFEAATVFEAKKGRLMAIGVFRGTVVTVIFELLGTQALSVVSMRRASRKERRTL